MLTTLLQRTFWFVLLLMLQVLVFNHIHIFGYATPMPFIYFLLILHSETPRWVYVSLGFCMGLAVDIFSNTIGESAGAMTFLGLITPNLLNAFGPSDKGDDGYMPSAQSMQWGRFLRYVLSATAIYVTIFFVMECFSLFYLPTLLIHIVASVALTLFVIIAIERIRNRGAAAN